MHNLFSVAGIKVLQLHLSCKQETEDKITEFRIQSSSDGTKRTCNFGWRMESYLAQSSQHCHTRDPGNSDQTEVSDSGEDENGLGGMSGIVLL